MASSHQTPSLVAERFELALELYELGEAMMRQQLLRKHPDLSPDALEEKLSAWLMSRPGAEGGDAEGRPSTWPRPGR